MTFSFFVYNSACKDTNKRVKMQIYLQFSERKYGYLHFIATSFFEHRKTRARAFLPSCFGKRLLSSPSGKRPKVERLAWLGQEFVVLYNIREIRAIRCFLIRLIREIRGFIDVRLLHYDLELRSSWLTLGSASKLSLLSLNRHLTSVLDIDSGCTGFSCQLPSVQRIPNPIQAFPREGFCSLPHGGDGEGFLRHPDSIFLMNKTRCLQKFYFVRFFYHVYFHRKHPGKCLKAGF